MMQTRRLGRTGHHTSLAILGGAAFRACTPDQAAAPFHDALDRGVNHLDVAPLYGDAELALGPHIPAVRHRLFVGCKTEQTTTEGVRTHLERSLERLGCDRFDLYQAHGVTSLDDLGRRDAAFEAIVAARDEGIVGFAGVTGHDLGAPKAHLEAVKRYDLDTVMFAIYPLVWADPVYRADAEALLSYCTDHDIGVQIIKTIARAPWGDTKPFHDCWYRPETDEDRIGRGVRFALAIPGVTAIATVGDLELLPRVLDAVERYAPMTAEEREGVSRAAADGQEMIFPLAQHFRRG